MLSCQYATLHVHFLISPSDSGAAFGVINEVFASIDEAAGDAADHAACVYTNTSNDNAASAVTMDMLNNFLDEFIQNFLSNK